MEELLNKLIEKGWKPFGDEKIHSFEIIYVTGKIWNIVAKRGRGQVNKHYSIREICSRESGLWQFVYDYELIETFDERRQHIDEEGLKDNVYFDYNYRYRLIESSLKDESELEDFLLDNIKIDE